MNTRSAIAKVNRRGMLLVFPINNRKEPPSLWSEFFPRTRLRWEWDENGSSKVFELWHLRERLSRSDKVVYSKWFRGRATLISFDLFPALLRGANPEMPNVRGLSFTAREILDLLEEDSPLSTKQIKRLADLRGRENEARYNRAMKELWARLLIVGYGEVDEGAFPSLAIGATRLIFEDLWNEAFSMSLPGAYARVNKALPEGSAFLKYWKQVLREIENHQETI